MTWSTEQGFVAGTNFVRLCTTHCHTIIGHKTATVRAVSGKIGRSGTHRLHGPSFEWDFGAALRECYTIVVGTGRSDPKQSYCQPHDAHLIELVGLPVKLSESQSSSLPLVIESRRGTLVVVEVVVKRAGRT